jgi:hypothetical protein
MHESVLVYRNLRYLKWSSFLVFLSTVLYLVHSPLGAPNGGTWLGYALGTIAAGIMLWLSWFGVRKRYYRSEIRLEGWLSGHIYLGFALVFVATLHAGFQLGWNIHSLLYVLMMIVVLSGFVGLYFYVRFPSLLAQNRGGESSKTMMTQIADMDREIRGLSAQLSDDVVSVTLKAVRETIIGGTLYRKLSGEDPSCPTAKARVYLESLTNHKDDKAIRPLLATLAKKEDILSKMRRDVQLRCLLQVWLYVHVPVTCATLAALVAHVISVFYFW